MPNMADITVKKADGTTDVVYTAMTPSSGDGVAAQWRAEAAASTVAFKPRLEMRSRANGAKTARRVDTHFVMPVTQLDSGSGITTVSGQIPISTSALIPINVSDSWVNEAVNQWANLMKASLIISAHKTGYAPT